MENIKDLPLDVRLYIQSFIYTDKLPNYFHCYVCGMSLCLGNRHMTAVDDSFDEFHTYEFCSMFCFNYEKNERIKYKDKPLAIIKY